MERNEYQTLTVNSEVPAHLVPENEAERLKALYRFEILDTPQEAFFDKITAFAAKIFDVPSAFISLVDLDRVWYKSNKSNLQVAEVRREDSLCSITILGQDEVTVFSDTFQVPNLVTSPYVKAEGGIRFYAGAPLTSFDGHNLGTVCVVDSKPRGISAKEKEILQDLAQMVVAQLELRSVSLKAARKHDELLSSLGNEVVPAQEHVTNLLAGIEVEDGLPAATKALAAEALESSLALQDTLQSLLLESARDEVSFLLHPTVTSIAEVARSTVKEMEALAAEKQQDIYFMVATGREMRIDAQLMHQAFSNLVKFGIVYSPPGSFIALDIFEADHLLHVDFTYEGLVLPDHELRKLFLRQYSVPTQSPQPVAISGDELLEAKKIIDAHKGTVTAKCQEKGKSCKIMVAFSIT